ncbi:MAG: hypothetical protein Fur0037_09650 [Planctomycetota bacterium]
MHGRTSLLALACVLASASAQDLGGGAPSSNGIVARFSIESWIPGTPSAFSFRDLPAGGTLAIAVLSGQTANLALPGVAGTFRANPFTGFPVWMGRSLQIPMLPPALSGLSLYAQGLFLDPMSGPVLTDAFRADFFSPVVMVGNQRQTTTRSA